MQTTTLERRAIIKRKKNNQSSPRCFGLKSGVTRRHLVFRLRLLLAVDFIAIRWSFAVVPEYCKIVSLLTSSRTGVFTSLAYLEEDSRDNNFKS